MAHVEPGAARDAAASESETNCRRPLRDRFAGQALIGLLAAGHDCGDFRVKDQHDRVSAIYFDRKEAAKLYAETAYILADAMVAAGEVKEGGN
jgi:hypothetical protein